MEGERQLNPSFPHRAQINTRAHTLTQIHTYKFYDELRVCMYKKYTCNKMVNIQNMLCILF